MLLRLQENDKDLIISVLRVSRWIDPAILQNDTFTENSTGDSTSRNMFGHFQNFCSDSESEEFNSVLRRRFPRIIVQLIIIDIYA